MIQEAFDEYEKEKKKKGMRIQNIDKNKNIQ